MGMVPFRGTFISRRYAWLTVVVSAGVVACNSDSINSVGGPSSSGVVYVQSNNPATGQNSVFAFQRSANGGLTPLAGSPFLTNGTGVANPTQMLGPDDLDQNMAVDRAHRVLYVVNGGSNTIAAMRIQSDGSLTPVAGSPFASGGVDPSSVGLAGDQLFVVNKAQDPAQSGGTPNYTGFSIAADGSISAVPGSTITSVPGASPSQALITAHQALLFGADFLAPSAPTPAGLLRAFQIRGNATLGVVPGTPMQIPGDSALARMALGLATLQSARVLYVGFTLQNKLGVYTYGADGSLSFVTAVPNSGAAICWLLINSVGNRLYSVNTATNSVSVYDITNPKAPVERQHLLLQQPGPTFDLMGMQAPTSQAFQEALSPDGRSLYVVSQHVNPDFSAPNGNMLHTLTVAADGTLREATSPIQLPVSTRTRPQGVIVF